VLSFWGCRSLSVGWLLRSTGGRILKILLPSVGCLVEEGRGVRQAPGAARIDRIGVEDLAVDGEEDAEAMLLTLRAFVSFRASWSEPLASSNGGESPSVI
jgi:hypothetical protein